MPRRLLALLCCLMLALPALAQGPPSLRQPEDADLGLGLYDSFFDDAVFVGDSVFSQLARYALERRQKEPAFLGKARFLVAGNYNLYLASHKKLGGDVFLRYRGRKTTVHDAMLAMHAGKAIVLLGLNDHAGSQLEKDIVRYAAIVDNVREVSPDTVFYAVSLTPITQNRQTKTLNQKNLSAFNQELVRLCIDKQVVYLDIASHLMTADGYLNADYSSDGQVHLNEQGLGAVVDSLRRYARMQYEAGLFVPAMEEVSHAP